MSIAYYDDPEYWERLDGRDFPKVSPRTTHSFVQAALISLLRVRARGHAKVLPELRCRIGAIDRTDSWLIPDIAVIANARWKQLANDFEREEPPFAPDIAVEIRSPGERAGYRERKVARYFATGAQLVLDVTPSKRQIDARSTSGTQIFRTGDRFSDPRFPWLEFDVAEAFEDLDDE